MRVVTLIHTKTWHYSSTSQESIDACQSIEEEILDWGISITIALKINLLVEELFLNTIHHGMKKDQPAAIEISVTHESSHLTVNYRDKAPEYNILNHVIPEDINEQVGGRGVLLIDGLTSSTTYKREGDFNSIFLTFEIPPT